MCVQAGDALFYLKIYLWDNNATTQLDWPRRVGSPSSGRVGSKSWNRIVGSIPNVGTDNSGRVADLEPKTDPKNRPESPRLLFLVIYFIFSIN